MTRLRQPKAAFYDEAEEIEFMRLSDPDMLLQHIRKRRSPTNDEPKNSYILVRRDGTKLLAEFEIDDLRDMLADAERSRD